MAGGEQSVMEHKLLVTYDAKEIKEIVQKLLGKVPKYQIMFLSEKVCEWLISIKRAVSAHT